MAIGAVLKDRARVIRKVGASERVEGTTQMRTIKSDWFRVRLFLPGGNESVAPSPPGGDGRVKDIKRPQLMWKSDGETLNFDDQVEVDSPQLGRAVWKVLGSPEPIRRRVNLIGYLANLQKISEGEYEDVT